MAALEANLDDTTARAPNSSDITAFDSTQCRTDSCLISSRLDLRRPRRWAKQGARRRGHWLVFIDLKIATLCQKLRLERGPQSPSLPGGSERLPPPFCRPGPCPGCRSSRSRGYCLARSVVARASNRNHLPWTVRAAFAVRAAPARPSLASGGGRVGAGCRRFSSACHRSTSPNQKALSLALRAAAARRRHSSARRRNSSCDLVRTTLKGRASSSMGCSSVWSI
jgi:hypothetical protein